MKYTGKNDKFRFEVSENVAKMFQRLPDLTYTYVRQELSRFANRFKRRLATERMQGPPGINWYNARTLKNSRHFKYYVEGSTLKSLAMVSKISGTLMMHETGGTITAKGDGWLYIKDRAAKYGGRQSKWSATQAWSATSGIVAKVKSVTLKPRLGFRALFNSMVPEERIRLQSAMNRAAKVASERNLKQVLKTV